MTDDLQQLRHTAEIYARGADRRHRPDWEEVLASDVVISGPGFRAEGLAQNLASIDKLGEMFKATRHIIHAQHVTVEGDRAHGETACTAEHRLTGRDGDILLVWAVRYQDEWQRAADGWRFTKRDIIVDWEELRPVHDTKSGR